MRQHRFSGIVAMTLLIVGLGQANDRHWIKLRSPNFELYTSASKRVGRRTIQQFEQARQVFGQALQWDVSHPKPVRIVLFRSKKEFVPFQPRATVAAYYLGTPAADLIVMVAGSEESTAFHEYVHLLVRRSEQQIPVWLNEGLAEIYSSLQKVGGQVAVGNAPRGSIATLYRESWIPLEQLVEADRDSELLTTRKHVGQFYSQSWALTHMLTFSEKYRSKYTTLIQLLANGAPSAETLETVYAISIEDLQRELQAHVQQVLLQGIVIDVKLDNGPEKPLATPATGLEVDLLLADLLAYIRKTEEARAMYRKASGENPDAPGPYEGLGHLEYRLGHKAQAKAYFGRAFELGSSSPRMLERYARLQREADDEGLVLTLVRAVKTSPQDIDARLALGSHLIEMGSYAQVVATLRQVQNPPAEQAKRVFRMLAYASLILQDHEGGRQAAEKLLELAQSPEDINYAKGLLARLERNSSRARAAQPASLEQHAGALGENETTASPDVAGAPREGLAGEKPKVAMDVVTGSFVGVECFGDQARIDLSINGAIVSLLIDDGSLVEIRGSDASGIDLACGRQEPRDVIVSFLPSENSELRTLGLVRAIEFTELVN